MRVLVTGAGSGIGRATAEVLTARGHDVVATARRVESSTTSTWRPGSRST